MSSWTLWAILWQEVNRTLSEGTESTPTHSLTVFTTAHSILSWSTTPASQNFWCVFHNLRCFWGFERFLCYHIQCVRTIPMYSVYQPTLWHAINNVLSCNCHYASHFCLTIRPHNSFTPLIKGNKWNVKVSKKCLLGNNICLLYTGYTSFSFLHFNQYCSVLTNISNMQDHIMFLEYDVERTWNCKEQPWNWIWPCIVYIDLVGSSSHHMLVFNPLPYELFFCGGHF